MSSKSKLKKNFFALIMLQISNYIIPLALIPYMLRVLGAEKYGLIAVLIGLTQFSYIITEFGFSQSATAKIAKKQSNVKYVSSVNGAVITIKFFAALICSILSAAYIYAYYPDLTCLSAWIGLIIFSQAFQPIWFFNGIEEMKNITIFMTTTKILHCIITFVLLSIYPYMVIVLISMAISNVIGTGLGLIFLFKTKYSINFPKYQTIKREFMYSLMFFWSRGAVSIYSALSVVFVGTFSGLHQASMFSICEQIYKAGKGVSGPVSTALYPYMVRTKNWSMFFRVLKIAGVTMFLGCSAVIIFSEQILNLVFGNGSAEAYPILNVLVVTVLVSFFGVYFGYIALVPVRKGSIANSSVIYGSIVFVIYNGLTYMSGHVSALSVAYSLLVTEIVVFFIRSISFFKAYNAQKR